MRLTRLAIGAFRVIKRADIDFGPGLNILYGPNDHGKSTIATALRAALLVPPSSSEAGTYGSWFGSDNPRVELTFVDESGHHWRVKKTFGTSSSSAAELHHSKDGIHFTMDCKARQVEEKLRDFLGWGIPPPGGKAGTRGVPESFLGNVLLAGQTDVDGILRQSITQDMNDSGKLRLTKALSTLAQDPLFKEVLQTAQREVEAFFTGTGRRKRGQSSRFKDAGDQVRELQAEIEARSRQLDDSAAIENEVNALRQVRSAAIAGVDEANATLAAVQGRFQNSVARVEATAQLAAARDALASIDAQIERLHKSEAELADLQARVTAQDRDLSEALNACGAADGEVRIAEDAHRAATNEDSARELELRRLQLSERAAELSSKLVSKRAQKAEIEAAIKARDDASESRAAVAAVKARLDTALKSRDRLREKGEAAATELEVARAIVAYVRWRSAVSATEEATKSRDAARASAKEADEKEASADLLETKVSKAEKKLRKDSSSLPDEKAVRALVQLERDLEKAEAALGGGISVAVRPSSRIAVRATIDQKPPTAVDLVEARTFEAERTITLAIGDLVELDITGGSADRRKAVDDLRRRWTGEALPLLERATVETRLELEARIAALKAESESLALLKRNMEELRSEARRLRDLAKVHEEKAASSTTDAEEVDRRKQAIGVDDVALIARRHEELGRPTESKCELLQAELTRQYRAREGELAAADQAAKMAEYQLSEAEKRAVGLETIFAARLSSLQSTDLDGLARDSSDEIVSLQRDETENASQMADLVTVASTAVEKAHAKLLHAREVQNNANDRRDRARTALEASRAAYNTRLGAMDEARAQVEKLDRASAGILVKERQSELAAFPIEPDVTEADVEAARKNLDAANRALDHAKEELHVKEGALTRVGGASLREEVERLEEARLIAEARERELEVDADAWKLLFDTLREVENEEGAHLGRALAGPVATRFEELTSGRYKGLRLDAGLQMESLTAVSSSASGDEVLDALSVGTRDQLAALIRLTIAEQLKSTIVLDDHLVHSDPIRLAWFRHALQRTAVNTQVIVLTCRSEDYLSPGDLPGDGISRDVAAGTIRAVNVGRALERWQP